MAYSTGYRPDPVGFRRTPFHQLRARFGGTVAELVSAFSIESFTPAILDQGATGSCVGHAVACGIFTSLSVKGTPLGFVPSPADIYRLARMLDRTPKPDGSLPPLEDQGSEPNQAERAVREWGVRPIQALPDRFSDADPSTINTDADLVELEADATSLIVGAYGIYSTGAQRGADVRASIAAGVPVTWAVPGGSAAWQNYAGGIVGATGEPLDHYVCLVGYAQLGAGWTYRIRNSWGSWGEGGDILVSESAVEEFGDIIAWTVEKR